MPYLNIDDGMDEHPKIDGLSDKAFRLHVSAMLYSARNLTDGYIPRPKVARLTETGSYVVAAELVRAGVWHDIGEGCDNPECIDERTCQTGRAGSYLIHDYLQWNHSKDWWEKRKNDQRERTRKWRAQRERETQQGSVTPPVTRYVTRDVLPQNRTDTEPDTETRTIPSGLALSVDGKGFVTDLQTAREERAKSELSEGESA